MQETRDAVPSPLVARPRRAADRCGRAGAVGCRRPKAVLHDEDVHRLDPVSASPGRGVVLAAWERFVQGEDHVPGVRPEVAISWHRCREQYRVDPHLTRPR